MRGLLLCLLVAAWACTMTAASCKNPCPCRIVIGGTVTTTLDPAELAATSPVNKCFDVPINVGGSLQVVCDCPGASTSATLAASCLSAPTPPAL